MSYNVYQMEERCIFIYELMENKTGLFVPTKIALPVLLFGIYGFVTGVSQTLSHFKPKDKPASSESSVMCKFTPILNDDEFSSSDSDDSDSDYVQPKTYQMNLRKRFRKN
jgi:hypothetical protein